MESNTKWAFADNHLFETSIMRGDRQNHTGSPCRPVTHLLSQKWPVLDILLRVYKGKNVKNGPTFGST